MIRHIVFWKFRPDADPEPFLQALSALPEQIDWIRGMHVARSAAPNAALDAALEADFYTLYHHSYAGQGSPHAESPLTGRRAVVYWSHRTEEGRYGLSGLHPALR